MNLNALAEWEIRTWSKPRIYANYRAWVPVKFPDYRWNYYLSRHAQEMAQTIDKEVANELMGYNPDGT